MKKLISLLLAVLAVVPMCLIGCADSEGPSDGSQSFESETVSEFDEWNRPGVASSIGSDVYFDDETVIILSTSWDKSLFYTSSDSGDVINAATYERNLRVQERLGVKIESYTVEDYQNAMNSALFQQLRAGDDSFHIGAVGNTYQGPLAIEGYYYNMLEVPYLAFSKPWWNQGYIEANTLLGQLYNIAGDINIPVAMNMECTFVNLTLAELHGVYAADLYAHVDNGTWTLETFKNYVKDFYIDDGNQKRDENDTYGLVAWSNNICLDGWTYAFGLSLTGRDDEDLPTLTFYDTRTEDLYGMLYNLYFGNEGVYFSEVKDFNYIGTFSQDRSMFMIAPLNLTNHFRDMNSTYGILPLPKADEHQKTYQTNCDSTALIIPSNSQKVELCGAVLEYMSEMSYRTVTPVVYEVALKAKYFADQDSGRMLDILISGARCDLAETYGMTISGGEYGVHAYSYLIRNTLRANGTTLSTPYKRYTNVYNRGLQKLIDGFKKYAPQ